MLVVELVEVVRTAGEMADLPTAHTSHLSGGQYPIICHPLGQILRAISIQCNESIIIPSQATVPQW